MSTNWKKLYKDYKGMWVALKSDEITVIASGPKLHEVKSKAANSGYEKPIFTKIPKENLTYIGNSR